jgi:hypothetical protein
MTDKQRHVCVNVEDLYKGILSEDICIEKNEGLWYIFLKRSASDVDVAAGQASHKGQIMFRSSFLIRFCPFCGIDLNI